MTRILIIGMGFAGLNAARNLANTPGLEVILIDRRNYHLFQPLLYQVASASIEQEAIAYPARAITRGWRNVRFLLAEVTAIDLKKRLVTTDSESLTYDHLIVAAGAVTGFYGMKDVQQYAYQIKGLADAVALRNHVLRMFEQAEWQDDPTRRSALLTFVIVGGGPTGVEFAGTLAELIRQVMTRDYPLIHPADAKIILLEAADSLLPMLPAVLRGYALHRLQRMGVQVRLGAKVSGAAPDQVRLSNADPIPSHTLVWAAGVQAAPLAALLDAPTAGAGRIRVQPDLSLEQYPEVFVCGDMAYLEQDGSPLPGIAPVAMQAGTYAARTILARQRGQTPAPFRYRDMGVMSVIGRGAAVASIFGLNFTGFIAWMVWLALHLAYLIGFRNRVVVLLNWAYDYLAFDRKIRLITWTVKNSSDQ
jgi:NADH dehydrogenase